MQAYSPPHLSPTAIVPLLTRQQKMMASVHRVILMTALLLTPSLAFGGVFRFRGSAARRIVATTSDRWSSLLAASFHPSCASSRQSACHLAVRGGGQRRFSSASSTDNELCNFSLPSSFEQRRDDVSMAIMSVFAACKVTRHVQPTSSKSVETIAKQDASPVTVGDFASQALALQVLHGRFPNDMFIAEEGSEALQKDEGLLDKVWNAVNHVGGDILDREQLVRAIDYGQGKNGPEGTSEINRVWCLDPIDGTKGFLRGRIEGGQYCIALGLIEDGAVQISVLGCPNLPLPSTPATETVPYGLWSEGEVEESETQQQQSVFSASRGCLFVAVRGCGCYEIPLHVIEEHMLGSDDTRDASEDWSRLQVTPNDASSKPTSQAKFALGVERGFSDPKGTVLKIAQVIHGPDALVTDEDGVQDIKNSLRMDGQGKYGLLARGDAECFLRLPKEGYVDWVWDVAAGYLVLEEAGGKMTDVLGREIDFSGIGGPDRRAKLPDHVKGILGSCGGVFHQALVDAYAELEQT